MDPFWSWILTAVGLAGFFLAGKKVWWCWYVNIANQVLWFTYAVVTEQWGFLVGVFAYLFVFIKNAVAWTKEHLEKKHEHMACKTIGIVTDIREDESGLHVEGRLNESTPALCVGVAGCEASYHYNGCPGR